MHSSRHTRGGNLLELGYPPEQIWPWMSRATIPWEGDAKMSEAFKIIAAYFAGMALLWFLVWGRHMPIRYQAQYSTSSDKVLVQKKPKDCEFLTAPLGSKNCDYEKVVMTEKSGADPGTGRPVISTDGGKTWRWNDGGPTKTDTYVFVTWEKVED
jgi:hypothetical protein